jgi:vacuolar-type H+-ATPase subunit D/Vma8
MISAFTLASCDSNNPNTREEQVAPSEAEISMTDVKQDMKDTYDTFENYLYDQKEIMVEKANKRIDKIDREIEAMEQKINQEATQVEDTVQAKTNAALNELKMKKEKLSKELNKLENSTSDAWDEMKDGFSDALKELEESLDKAGATMKG